jgi:hypothetical protein
MSKMGLKRRIESLIIDAIFVLAPGLGEEEAEVLVGWLDSKIDGGIPISEESLNNLGLREIHLQALRELPTHKKIIAALFAIPVGFEFEYVDALGDLIGTLTFGKFGFDMETWLFGSLNEGDTKDGKTAVADGGEDKRRRSRGGMSSVDRDTTWSDNQGVYRDIEGNDESAVNWSFVSSAAKFVAILGILGILGFAATSFLGIASGPASVAGDYLGANVDGPDLGGIGFMANKAVKTVSCFGDEGCIREWQINNTRRPGSEDVGETFKLNIRNYNVFAGGGSVDVSNKRADSSIPVSFFLQNTRNGLKGIPARDVQYRVSVRDESLLSSQNFCKTDWITLKTNYGSEDSGNVLIPGAGVSPVSWEDQLTLRKCGLLQPGAGNYVNFVLEVKYNYSSQSTHYIEVMSRNHMTEQGITPDPDARSETADTPVETYISTRDPVVFEESSGERYSIPFTARVSVNADDSDTRYRIDPEAFRFEDSDITSRVSDSCQGLNRLEGDTFALSDRVKSSIERTQTDQNEWFGDGNPPPVASCDLKIADDELNRVSRTGETLTMTADVNYTLKLSEREKSFKIFNNQCGAKNCPMLVPLSRENISAEVINTDLYSANPEENANYWAKNYATCDGNQDAQDGCSVIESFEVGDRGPMRNSEDEVITIDEGDIAVELSTAESSLIHCDSEKPEGGVQSIDPYELETAINSEGQALSKSVSGWRVESTESCEESEENN